MKKRLLCALTALMLIALTGLPALAAVVKPGKDFYYLDEAGVLSEALEGEIYFCSKRLEEACGVKLVVAVVEATDGRPPVIYAMDLFRTWNIGSKGSSWGLAFGPENDGLLLLLVPGDDGRNAIFSGCSLDYSDNIRDRLGDELRRCENEYLKPDCDAGRYEEGVRRFYEAIYPRLAEVYGADVTLAQGIGDYDAWLETHASDDSFSGSRDPEAETPGEAFCCVRDEADVLPENTEHSMIFANRLLEEAAGTQFAVVTVRDTGGAPIGEYARALFDQWGVGDAYGVGGVMLMMATEDQDYCIVTGANSWVEPSMLAVNDSIVSMEKAFSKGNYGEALTLGYDTLLSKLGSGLFNKGYMLNTQRVDAEAAEKACEAWVQAGSDPAMLTTRGLGGRSDRVLTRAELTANSLFKRMQVEQEAREMNAAFMKFLSFAIWPISLVIVALIMRRFQSR